MVAGAGYYDCFTLEDNTAFINRLPQGPSWQIQNFILKLSVKEMFSFIISVEGRVLRIPKSTAENENAN